MLVIAVWLIVPPVLKSQGGKVTFEASVSPKEVVESGRLQISFRLVGSINGEIQLPNFAPFVPAGSTQELSGVQMINNDINAHHTWVVGLIAPAAGTYTIPPAEVRLKGQTYRSEPLSIRVLPAGKLGAGPLKQVPPGADPNLFVTAETYPANPFVGQQVVLTIQLYARYGLSGIDLVRLPQLSKGALKELERYSAPEEQVHINGVAYNKATVYAAAFYPEAPGSLTISPIILNAAMLSRNPMQPFKNLQIQSNPVSIEVKPLPAPAPEGFSGLVGQYEVEFLPDRDTVPQGEVITCTLRLRGNGNPRMFSPPVLDITEGLSAYEPSVKEEETFENGREAIHRQTLAYTLSAKGEGPQTCSPILVWFDPDSNRYIRHTAPVALLITDNRQPSLTTDLTETDTPFWTNNKWLGWAALGLAGLLSILYFLLKKSGPGNTPAPAPPATPSPTPVASPVATPPVKPNPVTPLDRLHAGMDQRAFYTALYATLKSIFAEKMGDTPDHLSKENIASWMKARQWPDPAVQDLILILRTCEQTLYAAQDHRSEMPELLDKARQLVQGTAQGH